MYEGTPSDGELSAFGFTREDMSGEDFMVWPDNWQAFDVFLAMGTQWRAGMGGATGLDYQALEAVTRLHGVKRRDRLDVFEAVRIMEGAALKEMHKES